MVVEVEAYGGPPDGPWPDAASHSFRGRGGRNWVMFGPAGRLYTYRSHGIHVCANVVCATEEVAGAVLLRAAAVEGGIDVAQARRGDSTRPAALARGPGNLCSALGITMDDNGIDLFDAKSPVRLTLGEEHIGVDGPRVGVSKAADRPGGSGWPVAQRCRCIAVVRGHPLPAKAIDPSTQSAAFSTRQCGRPEPGAPRPATLVGEIHPSDDVVRSRRRAAPGRRASAWPGGTS